MKKRYLSVLSAWALSIACGGTWGQTGTTAAPGSSTTTASTASTAAAAPSTQGAANDKLVASFSDFTGSTQNASALVNGLRTGSSITLQATATTSTGSTGASTSAASTLSFTPPTRPMGYGNIRIALSLARAELAGQGITRPTPQQLQTALMGGTTTPGSGTSATTTQTQGILQMRASGMGWGQIANSLGYKLGAVMSGHVPAAAPTTSTAATVTSKGAAATTTAGGASAGHGKASGIVSAGGGSVTTGQRHTGGAATAGGAGVMSAQGAAHGQGLGTGGKGKP